jgi:hypothetical protein
MMNENVTRKVQNIRTRAAAEMGALFGLGSEIDDPVLKALHQIAVRYVNDVEGPFLLEKLWKGSLTEEEENVILRRAEAVLELATNHRKTIQDAIDKHRQPDIMLVG